MDTTVKNKVLRSLADLIMKHEQQIIEQNQLDIQSCGDIDPTLLDRLKVDEKKVAGMAQSVLDVMEMEDPAGKVLYKYEHPNGMQVENRTVPFGTILIIYESRPDVTIESAVSAFKAGNKILLKGGKEAKRTNTYLVQLWHQALQKYGVDTSYVTYLDMSREDTQEFICDSKGRFHLVLPRGGEKLIEFVSTNADAPVIVSGRGNNFLYVDASADFEMATSIILNGKARLSVCNALDKVLLNRSIEDLPAKLAKLVNKLREIGISVYGVEEVCKHIDLVLPREGEEMLSEEFLSAKILIQLVDDMDEAIALINQHSGGHSAVIVSEDEARAQQFQTEVDCAAVYHNASTRFTDGGQFGFGAEIAISTQKLHFRGPLGAGQLISNKWFIQGKGQIRE